MTLCAFFYAPLRNGIDFLFHTQTLADPLILTGYWLILTRSKSWWGFFSILLAMACKESVIVDVLGLSLFLVFSKKPFGWFLLLTSVACLTGFIFVIEPLFRCPGTFMDKWGFFSYLSTPSQWNNLKFLLTPNPFKFICLVLAPLLFLPLFARGSVVLLAPSLLFRLLSSYGGFRLTTAHYTAGMNALIFIAMIHGFQILKNSSYFQSFYNYLLKKFLFFYISKSFLLGACLIFTSILFSGMPRPFRIERFIWEATNADNQAASCILESIPKNLSVLATEKSAAHLSHRPLLFVFGQMFPGTPYYSRLADPDLIVVDGSTNGSATKDLDTYKARGYQKIFETRLLKIYQRPTNESLISSELLEEWREVSERPEIPFRKTIKWWYKRIFLVFLAFLLFFSVFTRSVIAYPAGLVN